MNSEMIVKIGIFFSAWAYHPAIKDVKGLPTVPAQPIAASDAEYLLRYYRI